MIPTQLTSRVAGRALAAAIAVVLLAPSADAQRANPFAGLSGAWGGGGTLSTNNGSKERIRCRAQYRESGADLQLELRCASDTYKFELQSSLSHSDGAISGTWSEVSRGAVGNIAGNSSGNQINLRATSPVFSAALAVVTRGNHQSISIQSPGSEISSVAITLNRGGR